MSSWEARGFALSQHRQVWPFSKIQKTAMVQKMAKALSCVSVISGWLISGKGVSEDPSDVFPNCSNSQNPEDSSVQL